MLKHFLVKAFVLSFQFCLFEIVGIGWNTQSQYSPNNSCSNFNYAPNVNFAIVHICRLATIILGSSNGRLKTEKQCHLNIEIESQKCLYYSKAQLLLEFMFKSFQLKFFFSFANCGKYNRADFGFPLLFLHFFWIIATLNCAVL